MDKREAYINMLDAIQDYIQTVHGDNTYARDWILLTGLEAVSGSKDYSDVRMDTSPNTSNWAVYGLLEIAIQNFQTENE